MLFIRIERNVKSYEYKQNPKAESSYLNNTKNNFLDKLELFDDEALLFEAKCQSVANSPKARFSNTIAAGQFNLVCFINLHKANYVAHGICNTSTLGYEWLSEKTVNEDFSHSIHNNEEMQPVIWSTGDIILHRSDFEALNIILTAYHITPYTLLDGEIVDIE